MPTIADLAAVDETVADGDLLVLHNISKATNLKDQGLTITKLRTDAFLGRANTWSAAQAFSAGVITQRARTGATGSIADDTAATIAVPSFPCLLMVSPASSSTPIFIAHLRSNATAPVVLTSTGGTVTPTTGILGGTTGADARVNISVHTDNNCYVENRMGYGINYTYLFMG